MSVKQGTPGSANWGTFKPNDVGICLGCGRPIEWHAGRSCFAPDEDGLPTPVPIVERVRRPAPWKIFYKRKCKALSRAVWRDQVTDAEASREAAFWHRIGWVLNWGQVT